MDCIYAALFLPFATQSTLLLPHIHPFSHKFTQRRRSQPRKDTASSLVAVRVRCLAQGHLNTVGRAGGDQTFKLPVTSQPTLPPEPHAAPTIIYTSMLEG